MCLFVPPIRIKTRIWKAKRRKTFRLISVDNRFLKNMLLQFRFLGQLSRNSFRKRSFLSGYFSSLKFFRAVLIAAVWYGTLQALYCERESSLWWSWNERNYEGMTNRCIVRVKLKLNFRITFLMSNEFFVLRECWRLIYEIVYPTWQCFPSGEEVC